MLELSKYQPADQKKKAQKNMSPSAVGEAELHPSLLQDHGEHGLLRAPTQVHTPAQGSPNQ